MDEKKAVAKAKAVADECIAKRIRFLNRTITAIYDRALRPLDIKINQATILVFLLVHGESGPGDIGRALQMEKSTVSRNVERMRKKGWVETTDRGGRSSQIVSVTMEGKKLLAAAHAGWAEAQREASEVLGKEGVGAVRMLYDRVKS
jgi:DNA-binding MarR family transcriptional regulator